MTSLVSRVERSNGAGDLTRDDAPLAEYAGRFPDFVRDCFGMTLFPKQQEIVESIYSQEETYVRSGNGVGKTTTVSLVAEYHFSVLGCSVITTAPTYRQVDDLVWGQGIRTLRSVAKLSLPGQLAEGKPWIKTRKGGTRNPGWFMKGFSTDRPERAQGPHLDNLLIIIDEASGITRRMMAALKGWMTNNNCRLVAIGNPSSDRSTPFWVAFHERSGQVGTIHIKLGDSPYVSQKWVEERRLEWGEDSEEFQARVLGEFPSDEDDKAIPMAWAEAGTRLWHELPPPAGGLEDQVWVKVAWDVAGKGQDKNALFGLTADNRIWVIDYWKEPKMLQSAIRVFQWLRSLPVDRRPRWLIADVTGRGEGAGGKMEELFDDPEAGDVADHTRFVPVDFGGGSDLPEQAERKRDELYYRARMGLNPQAQVSERYALPPDDMIPAAARDMGLTAAEIRAQLNTPAKFLNSRGRFKCESKAWMKKRGVKSPDAADAAVMLFHQPPDHEVKVLVF